MNAEIYFRPISMMAGTFCCQAGHRYRAHTLEIGVEFSMNVGTADIRRLTFVRRAR